MCVFTQVKNGTVQKGALNDFLMVFDLAYWEKKQTKREAQNKMKDEETSVRQNEQDLF